MSVFASLHPEIQAALAEKGMASPTAPQTEAIPHILAGKNVLLIAPTGMGKTESAILPIFHHLLSNPGPGIRALYITPLRALNRDMLARLTWFGEVLGLSIAVRHGDTTQAERNRQSKNAPDILITTPETLQVMFTGKRLRAHLQKVQFVVVDEVHELATSERGLQLAAGLERLRLLAGREFQRIGLSATVGSPQEVANFLGGVGREVEIARVSIAKSMKIGVERPTPTDADEKLAETLRTDPDRAASIRRAREAVESHRATLFFVNTRDTAEALAARFRIWDKEFPVGVHHGSLSKDVRIQMEDDFKAEKLKGLICTSSLELGIDVGAADFTLQYSSPREVSRLVQRTGRAGHSLGKTSEGLVLAQEPDDVAESGVIARRALAEELESIEIRPNSLGVLANQILAHTMMERNACKDDFYTLIRRAYPFRNLSRSDFDRVLEQLADERLLWLTEDQFQKKRATLTYFFSNISMIPDERTFMVRDITSRRVIGTLDEAFVISYAQGGAKLIIRGLSWRVVDVCEEELLVEPSDEVGAVPSWVGEDIPVPFAVAQEVGTLRRQIWEALDSGVSIEPSLSPYPFSKDARDILEEYIKKQMKKGLPLPSDRQVTVEGRDRTIIINACFGTKANETLARLLSALLAARIGESVGIRVDPYRIMLSLPLRLRADDIKDTLLGVDIDSIPGLLRLVLKNASFMKWAMVHVARKFGAIKKDADVRSINIGRLMETFYATPLYEEAVEKVVWERMDIDRVQKLLRLMKSGDIEVVTGPISPIGIAGVDMHKELMAPQMADRAVLKVLKKRLEDGRVRLVCISCKSARTLRVGNVPDLNITCPSCDGMMLAAVHPHSERHKVLKKKKPTQADAKEIKKLYKNATLIKEYGKRAVLALVGRGIAEDTAGRILIMRHTEEDDFLRDVLKAEVAYARTKRFWD